MNTPVIFALASWLGFSIGCEVFIYLAFSELGHGGGGGNKGTYTFAAFLLSAVVTAIPAAVAAILFQVGSIYSKRVQTRESAFTLGIVSSLVASALSITLGMSWNSIALIVISFVGIASFFCFVAPFLVGTRVH